MSLANFDKERGPAHLRGALEACIADQKRREEEADLNTRDEHDERLAVAADDTYDALMSVPPPSAAAFAEKLLIQSIRIDDERGGFTDPAYVAQQLHSYLPNRAAVLAYIDARHLAGDRSPLAGADFNPRAWIRLYEAAGGAAQERADRGGLMLGRAFQCKDPSSCRALEDELYYTPWKARAVRMEVLEDNYSTHGPNDNTGRFSWLLFTDADFNILTPRIHFVREDDDRGPSSGPSGGGNLPSAAAA
jgi:hypothetical protein